MTLSRSRCSYVLGLGVLVLAVTLAPSAAEAQLQVVNVDCAAGGNVAAALASITDRNGPNVINVAGTCNTGLNVTGFNRLTIQGNATFVFTNTQFPAIFSSDGIVLNGITLDGGAGLQLQSSVVRLTNVTVKNVFSANGISVTNGSTLTLDSPAPGNRIMDNGAPNTSGVAALFVDAGSAAFIHGFASITGNDGYGLRVQNGGHITVDVSNNGVVEIANNTDLGIFALNSTINLTTSGTAEIRIHDNDEAGVFLVGSSGFFAGKIRASRNNGTGIGLLLGSMIILEGNVEVSDEDVALLVVGQSTIAIGGDDAPGLASFTGTTAGLSLEGGSLAAAEFPPSTFSSVRCDATSWTIGDLGTPATNNCGDGAPTGVVGPVGPQGPPGLNGAPGAQGPPGPAGADGAAGATGATGAPGATGAQGPQGAPGADGAPGAQGPAGAPGAQGAQGPAGPTGATGAQGAQGVPGANGAPGAPGAQGPAGLPGPAGPQGPAGTPGAVGAQGPIGPQGLQGLQGIPGPSASQTWLTYIRQFGSTFRASVFTPDTPITVTRMQLQMPERPQGCVVNARVQLTDGTTNLVLTVNAAQVGSGPVSLNFAAGVPILVWVSRSATCPPGATPPADANVIVQYRAR